MTQDVVVELADAWIRYWQAPEDSAERGDFDLAMKFHDIEYHQPKILWTMILAIHSRHQSIHIKQVLSAGPLENLLALHGEGFIDRVESEAQRDPSFANLLGGVWKNRMPEEVWQRVQAVRDRRGWDGIPE
ncbi:MAG: DUF6869 domain-containing protein [Terracidiphilus sp.]|jgi:hypothetical protein